MSPPQAHPTDALDGRVTYYDATVGDIPAVDALHGNHQSDCVVIGGGFTGVSAALHLAEQGADVVLLEAARIGAGGSGRNGGQSLTGVATGMAGAKELLGETQARAVWEMSLAARQLQDDLIRRHAIACDAVEGYIWGATRDAHLSDLEEEYELLAGRWGYNRLDYAGEERLGGHIDSPRFIAGLIDRGSLHLNPLKLLLALSEAARRVGARLYEQSAATAITSAPDGGVTVQTASGTVTAKSVILAGNAYLQNIGLPFQRYIMPIRTFIMATAPLGEDNHRKLMPSNMCVCDCNHVLDYFRFAPDSCLLFGARVTTPGQSPRDLAGKLQARIAAVFPQLDRNAIAPTHLWAGNVGVTRNRLPHFGRFAIGDESAQPNALFAQGFSGHGVALSTLAGQILAEATTGTLGRFDLLAGIQHRPYPPLGPLKFPLARLAMFWRQLQDLL